MCLLIQHLDMRKLRRGKMWHVIFNGEGVSVCVPRGHMRGQRAGQRREREGDVGSAVHGRSNASTSYLPVPPTSTDLSVFLRNLCTNYGQKVKNTDVKSAPEGVASITANGGLERYTENSRKIWKMRSLPTDWCKGDLEVLICATTYCKSHCFQLAVATRRSILPL